MGKPVSIKPNDFTDESEQDRLLSMSCEEVVEFKASQESKRTSNMPDEAECESRVHFRSIPFGLVQALDVLAKSKGRSRRLVTKCLAHHAVALVSSLAEINEINRLYGEVIVLHGRHGGLVAIIEQMDSHQFSFHSERIANVELRVANKLLSYFSDRSQGLGIDVGMFLAVGLVWSLSTTQDDGLAGAAVELSCCLSHFRQYVFDRSVLMRAYKTIANSHIKAGDTQNK